jgi:cytochrome P450
MTNALFLQSDVADPYGIYSRMLAAHPVYWDQANNIWAVYSYDACRSLLNSNLAEIPGQNNAAIGMMNAHAAIIVSHLARLSNPPLHPMIRQALLRLSDRMQPVGTASLLDDLLGSHSFANLDWVDAVCKKLPALSILKGFGFMQQDIDVILPCVERLTKIMLPNKTVQQIEDINAVTESVYPLVERRVRQMGLPESETLLAVYVSNLIGMLIQSYDAGRGILANALLQQLGKRPSDADCNPEYFQDAVIETLRFDPPIHNTRRVLTDDVVIGKEKLEKGQAVLLVLAAANRDPAKFAHPDRHDVSRSNNAEHLTFGSGMHLCVARHLSARLAADALLTVFGKFKRVELLKNDIAYEPLINARLPKEIRISLG